MPSMEFFWGVEVKPGQTVSCDPEKGCILRISQAALGETKKGSHNIVVSAKVDDQKVIIGTLSAENRPQFVCNLIFHKEFELSHSSKTVSVFVCGYRAVMPDQPDKDEGEVKTVNNQVINPIAAADDGDSSSSVNNQVINPIAAADDGDSSSSDDLTSSGDDMTEDESSSEDDSSEEDDSSSEEDDSSSEELDSSSEEDSSDEEDINIPKKTEDGKKRVAKTALKTPASDKKGKIATPSGRTTGDKVPRVATPHPAKQASKASGNSNSKAKAKSPKSVGTHVCKSCGRTFVCDSALQSHEKTKHA